MTVAELHRILSALPEYSDFDIVIPVDDRQRTGVATSIEIDMAEKHVVIA